MKTMQPYLSPKVGIRKCGRVNEESCCQISEAEEYILNPSGHILDRKW